MSNDRGVVWVDDTGTAIYRASGLYSCTSILVASRLGITGSSPPAWMQERFDQGHNFEAPVLEHMRVTRGFQSVYGQQMETIQPVGRKALIVGHIDALGTGEFIPDTIDGVNMAPGLSGYWTPPGPVLIDVKAFAQSTWDKWVRDRFAAFPYYAWQQSIYAKALGDIPICMAIALKDMEAAERGEVVIKDFRLDVYTKPPVPFGQIMAKVLKVEKLAALGTEGIPTECDMATFPCPYWSLPFHTKAAAKVTINNGSISGKGVEGLVTLAEERAEATARKKAAENEIEALDEQMRVMVGGMEGEAKVGKWSDTLSSLSFYHATVSGVDWDAVKVDYPGFDVSKYKTSKPSEKLSVKVNQKRPAAKPNVAALVD